MFRQKGPGEAHSGNHEQYKQHPKVTHKGLGWLAVGAAASLLLNPNGHNQKTSQATTIRSAPNPPAEAINLANNQHLENPCQQPYQPINAPQGRFLLADIASSNPLLACLSDLKEECWDVDNPNPQGGMLCIDYGSGSVHEVNNNTFLTFNISVEDGDFYDYAMYVPFKECEMAVRALKASVQQKFVKLPAASNLHKAENQIYVGGRTTGCLPEERSAALLVSSDIPPAYNQG